ncbi:hypothetical protein QOM18_00695 [Serratia marcescens]|uniref:hypothetical protein n=1 Tax=Serratia marcescens TaxID=615 RepID=UPI0024C4E27C|nr:hypothetical protein [Serratia marcescens]MDK1706828.1 hypothetical protein [Serratia marcescens]
MVQRYNPDYVMHAARFEPFARENEHGEFVKFSDYEALKAERDALQKRADALAVENQALKAAGNKMFLSAISLMEDPELKIDHSRDIKDWERNETPATDAALSAIEARAKVEAIEQLAIQLEQLPDEALEFLSDAAEFETYQEEHHTFVSISNPRAVANAVLSLVKEQSTDPREAK